MRTLTIDVEDYYSLVVRDVLGLEIAISSHVDNELRRLLDLLDELQVLATCFVVGKLARERPDLVREIRARDHDVASHGYEHIRLNEMSPKRFEEDLHLSIEVLQDVTGEAITGHRAAAFSLGPEQSWAFNIMRVKGIKYDSSVRMVLPFEREAAERLCKRALDCGIEEHPSFALGWRFFRVPLAGGGGLRLLPSVLTKLGSKIVESSGYPRPLTYLHPYDLRRERYEGGWPIRGCRDYARLMWFNKRQWLGRSRVESRLRALVRNSKVAGTSGSMECVGWPTP